MSSIIVSEITLPFDTIRDALKVFPEWKIIYQVGNDALFDLPASQVKLKFSIYRNRKLRGHMGKQ